MLFASAIPGLYSLDDVIGFIALSLLGILTYGLVGMLAGILTQSRDPDEWGCCEWFSLLIWPIAYPLIAVIRSATYPLDCIEDRIYALHNKVDGIGSEAHHTANLVAKLNADKCCDQTPQNQRAAAKRGKK